MNSLDRFIRIGRNIAFRLLKTNPGPAKIELSFLELRRMLTLAAVEGAKVEHERLTGGCEGFNIGLDQ